MRTVAACLLALALCAGTATGARAWGAEGHRIINGDAIRALPDSMPAFLRTPEAIAEIAALGPEADRLRAAGGAYDAEFDPAHFLDTDDDATVAGVVPLDHLPPSREAFDAAVRGGHAIDGHPPTMYRTGYLPYSIIEGWQMIVQDFAIWRVDSYGETNASNPVSRDLFATDRKRREVLILRDIGYWGHFVADGSQPLHTSVHYNGWGNYPNPNNYTQSHTIHADFETKFVNDHATAELVLPRIKPYVASTVPIGTRVGAYLKTTLGGVPTVYQLAANGSFDNGSSEAIGFTLDRLAAGAQEMRDLIADAYAASLDAVVGYPPVHVRDVLGGLAVARPDAKN